MIAFLRSSSIRLPVAHRLLRHAAERRRPPELIGPLPRRPAGCCRAPRGLRRAFTTPSRRDGSIGNDRSNAVTRRNTMRRMMVVGAVILAIVAVVGIGIAAFNAGVDEGISRSWPRAAPATRWSGSSGPAMAGAMAAGSGLVRADPVPAVHRRDRAAGQGRVRPRPLGRSPVVGTWRLGPGGPGGYGLPDPGAARRRSTSITGACTSSPGPRPVPVTPQPGAQPGRRRPTQGRPERTNAGGAEGCSARRSSGFGRAAEETMKRILVVEDGQDRPAGARLPRARRVRGRGRRRRGGGAGRGPAVPARPGRPRPGAARA